MNLLTTIQRKVPGFNGEVAAHVMPWFGDGNIHRAVPYLSNNNYTIAKQLELMQSVGITVVILTWQGSLVTFQHSTAQEMVIQCGERGMKFMLLIDPWCAKTGVPNAPTTNVKNALSSPSTQAILNAPAYAPEKYVLDFNSGADLPTLQTAFPQLQFLALNKGFSWPAIPFNMQNYTTQNAADSMKIPGVCIGFNDAGYPDPKTGVRDYSKSVWGNMPARVLDTAAGNFLNSQWPTIKPSSSYIAFVTWNDYDEQSSGPLEAYISAMSGNGF